jgi:cephalosporin hydroxylase
MRDVTTRIAPRPVVKLYDRLCLAVSVLELKLAKRRERSVADAVETCGTFTEPGRYRGAGTYRSLRAQQATEEIVPLVKHVAATEPETVCEIGTDLGGTLYVWSRAFNSVTRFVSVDVDHRSREPLFRRFERSSTYRFVEGASQDPDMFRRAADAVPDEGVDFLYVDGAHDYQSVKQDFEMYRTLLAADALVAFHDVGEDHAGVNRLWNELSSEYESRVFGEGSATTGLLSL